jgi:hypothetical protein
VSLFFKINVFGHPLSLWVLCAYLVAKKKKRMERKGDIVSHGYRIVTSKVLGEGQFGKVYLGENAETGDTLFPYWH